MGGKPTRARSGRPQRKMQCDSVSTPVRFKVKPSRRQVRRGSARVAAMQHIITSSSTATVRMRVEPARRAHDQSNSAGEDSLGSFKGIAFGVLLSAALWMFLLGLYFLI
jgi:hypothetical protein